MSAPIRLLRSPSRALRPCSVASKWPCLLNSQAIAAAAKASPPPPSLIKSLTTLREDKSGTAPQVWFTQSPSRPRDTPQPPLFSSNTPDDNKAKLGKTLRILQDRLPTLLQSPLPQEVLSPIISLHLFPSTHPHLPAVSGRVAYKAAIWTSPIAWNRIPVVGNVRLEILSERMMRCQPGQRQGAIDEQLIVRWRTSGDSVSWGLPFLNGGASDGPGVEQAKDFTGLFIFEFDKEGRILSHTIEHVNQSGQWVKGVGAKVVGLTDWLLGGIKGGREGSDTPCPAYAGKDR